MIAFGGITILGIIWFILAGINVVISILTGDKPRRGGPRKRAGLKYRHTSETRWE